MYGTSVVEYSFNNKSKEKKNKIMSQSARRKKKISSFSSRRRTSADIMKGDVLTVRIERTINDINFSSRIIYNYIP